MLFLLSLLGSTDVVASEPIIYRSYATEAYGPRFTFCSIEDPGELCSREESGVHWADSMTQRLAKYNANCQTCNHTYLRLEGSDGIVSYAIAESTDSGGVLLEEITSSLDELFFNSHTLKCFAQCYTDTWEGWADWILDGWCHQGTNLGAHEAMLATGEQILNSDVKGYGYSVMRYGIFGNDLSEKLGQCSTECAIDF